MFVLAAAKHRTDLIDGVLATAVFLGLTLNAAAGLWWADLAAAFVIVYYGAREGWHALHATAGWRRPTGWAAERGL